MKYNWNKLDWIISIDVIIFPVHTEENIIDQPTIEDNIM